MLTKLGGRKFLLAVIAILGIVFLKGAPPEAYTAIALIVASFAGANGWVEGKWANKAGPADG